MTNRDLRWFIVRVSYSYIVGAEAAGTRAGVANLQTEDVSSLHVDATDGLTRQGW